MQDCLVRLDTKRLEAAIRNKNKTEMKACESVVFGGVETIGLDSATNRIVIVSPTGQLSMADSA